MNKIYLFLIGVFTLVTGCVADYTDANPPGKLDAPTLRLSAVGNNQKIVRVPVNAYQNNYVAYAQYGGSVEFTVSVIDAPGKVSTVSVVPSVPDFGSVTLDNATVTSIAGQERGDFKFTFTPNPALVGQTDRSLNLDITVSDSQLDPTGEAGSKNTILTVATNLVACLGEELEEGTYVVTAASGNRDGGIPYTLDDLKLDGELDQILVTVSQDRPGLYTIDEVSGGVWPVYYTGRAVPELKVDLCGSTIQGHEGDVTAGSGAGPLRKFTIDGTLNSDGTVNIIWSYERTDAASPANPAKGIYSLSKL